MNNQKKIHSKSKALDCTKLETAEYLKSAKFNTKQKQLLFKLRSKTLDVKQNFPGKPGSPWCRTCKLFPEFQSHLLQCPEIVTKLNYLDLKTSTINENMIYSDLQKQEIIVNIYSDILEIRKNLLARN